MKNTTAPKFLELAKQIKPNARAIADGLRGAYLVGRLHRTVELGTFHKQCERIFKANASHNQITKTIEELGELIAVLARFYLEQGNARDVISELADAKIMIEQMCIAFDQVEVEKEIARKIKRQIVKRMGEKL